MHLQTVWSRRKRATHGVWKFWGNPGNPQNSLVNYITFSRFLLKLANKNAEKKEVYQKNRQTHMFVGSTHKNSSSKVSCFVRGFFSFQSEFAHPYGLDMASKTGKIHWKNLGKAKRGFYDSMKKTWEPTKAMVENIRENHEAMDISMEFRNGLIWIATISGLKQGRIHQGSTNPIWLVVEPPTPLKNDGLRQFGWWHSQYDGKYDGKVIIHAPLPSRSHNHRLATIKFLKYIDTAGNNWAAEALQTRARFFSIGCYWI